jgi:NAD(P)H-dependent nitrite reductase small subunit
MTAAIETATITASTWTAVCDLEDIAPWSGVAAMIRRKQIALLRWGDTADVYALANFDPFSNAMVISRGIVGDLGGARVVASPIYKQHFRLIDGVCLEDSAKALASYPIRVVDGRVLVSLP